MRLASPLMSAAPRLRFSPTEFLDWEARQPERHEYFGGEIFAMAGGTERHARIIGNLFFQLRLALKEKGCTVYTDALRVRVEAEDLFTYPDLSIVCGPGTFYDDKRTTLLDPTLLVEVLSDSTETYDRTTKWRFYRQIPSLQTYVMVSQRGRAVDLITRDGEDWRLRADADGSVQIESLGLSLDLDEIYEGVTFPETSDRPGAAG